MLAGACLAAEIEALSWNSTQGKTRCLLIDFFFWILLPDTVDESMKLCFKCSCYWCVLWLAWLNHFWTAGYTAPTPPLVGKLLILKYLTYCCVHGGVESVLSYLYVGLGIKPRLSGLWGEFFPHWVISPARDKIDHYLPRKKLVLQFMTVSLNLKHIPYLKMSQWSLSTWPNPAYLCSKENPSVPCFRTPSSQQRAVTYSLTES